MEKAIIKPTVGRKILFWPATNDQSTVINGDQPFDATIVYVHNERLINVVVRDHIGIQTARQDVPLVQPDDYPPTPDHHYATWMPYQIGQAAKTEALQEQVSNLQQMQTNIAHSGDSATDGAESSGGANGDDSNDPSAA